MEMASGCLKQENRQTPTRPVRGPHGGWKQPEIDLLKNSISEAAQSGESLRSVFDRIALQLGRKPNSIRNFYYAQLRAQTGGSDPRALPFETFSPDEVEQLIADVLAAKAQGLSVRACVRRLADGDRTLMLRYQNKYRSTVRNRPELVQRVMDRLREQGIAFVSPYAAGGESTQEALVRLQERADHCGDPRLSQLFASLDYLLDLALAPKPEEPGIAFSADSDTQRKADRLGARCDLLRIALDDEQVKRKNLSTQAEGMVTLLKEFIALPEDERPCASAAFCRQAAARLSAMECALMDADV